MTDQMNQPKAQLVPVVYGDGTYAMTTLPQDSRWHGRSHVQLYQVVGGQHDGTRGGWVQLEEIVGRENIERADEYVLVHYTTRKLLKPKRITITIGHEEQLRLNELAMARGVTADELLASFVADLTRSIRSNGSDERMYAEQWLDRVGWPADFGGVQVLQVKKE